MNQESFDIPVVCQGDTQVMDIEEEQSTSTSIPVPVSLSLPVSQSSPFPISLPHPKVRKPRGNRCGLCDGCQASNCLKCKFCLDKPSNGGPGKLKQACVMKACQNKKDPVPIPTSSSKKRKLDLSINNPTSIPKSRRRLCIPTD